MKSSVRRSLLVSLFVVPLVGIQYCDAGTTPVTTEKEAEAIAEAAFLKHTKHAITDYSVRPGPHSPKEWRFFFMGEKSFAIPGNHWDVAVDRSTGAITIQDGL
jgi:hypothetical protein